MEKVIIKDVDLIDPNMHDLFWYIVEEINKFNENDDSELTLRSADEFLSLHLNGKELTVGEDFEVLKRVKQINRENGYDMF